MRYANNSIEIISRLVVYDQGHILLAHQIGASHTFLPGGHVEPGETAETALAREIKEELGLNIYQEHFMGVIECMYQESDNHHHELNLLFSGRLANFSHPKKPVSLEPHLEFFWQPVVKLANANLLPKALVELLGGGLGPGLMSVWCSEVDHDIKGA